MKALAVFPQSRRIDVIDHPEPEITSDRQVKLRMIDIGVCGTDKDITTFSYEIGRAHV